MTATIAPKQRVKLVFSRTFVVAEAVMTRLALMGRVPLGVWAREKMRRAR